jgi:chemotaxis signal transduction protein
LKVQDLQKLYNTRLMNSYLTFIVSDEVFALHVSNVMEIREYAMRL